MSTQNDWEARYEEFITFVTNEKNWIDGRPVWKEHKYVTLANAIQYFIRKELADARKEVIDRIEKVLCNHNYSSMKSKEIFNVKEEIRDVLAILREEEEK